MLHIFAQAHAARMWPDRLAKLGGNQQHGQNFVQTAHAARIDLHNVDRAFRDELLEHDAVLAHFASGDLHVANGFANLAMAGNIIRAGRLLDEERL